MPVRLPRLTLILLTAAVLITDVGILAASSDPDRDHGMRGTCPSLLNERHFGDERDRCATAATALPVGEVPDSELPCWASPEEARFSRTPNSASISIGDSGNPPRGLEFCDAIYAAPGKTLYFDFNTILLNDPVFGDYKARLPVGFVIDRTQPDCLPAPACRNR